MYQFRYASEVSVSDEVLIKDNDKLMQVKVINVTRMILQGDSDSMLKDYAVTHLILF